MNFREREKKRLIPLKSKLLSKTACQPGSYRKKLYDFCIEDNHSSENLHESIRKDANIYFRKRKIVWHDGKTDVIKNDLPSNHLCCSQTFCINTWFPYINKPTLLKKVLKQIGFPVNKVLPITGDKPLSDGKHPYVAFEWIGQKNYLNETKYGKVVSDNDRTRGQGFTSADFAFRFEREDGKIQIIIGEWKYIEFYVNNRSIRFSSSKKDRLDDIYRDSLLQQDCKIKLPKGIDFNGLFYDPFDQLMRLQLLASAMEREKEMDADVVSVLHIAPKSNRELVNRITSHYLHCFGDNIHDVWNKIVINDRFKGIYTEDLLPVLYKFSPNDDWSKYLKIRYGNMR